MHHGTLQHQGAWSFGDSNKSQWYLLPSKEVPAPNVHCKTQQSTAPAWTIGRAERTSLNQQPSNVGVGSYNMNMTSVYPASKNQSIGNDGKRTRGPRYTTVVTYNPRLQTIKPKPPSFSLGYRIETEYDNGRPGPADYENTLPTQTSFNQADHQFTMTAKIDPASKKKIPGVGQYNITSKYRDSSPEFRFGSAGRPSPGLNNSSPGLFYNIDEKKKDGHGITMGQQLPISFNKFIVPGPDKYNLNEKKKYEITRKKSMYTSNRSECVNANSSFGASPGSYDVGTSLLDESRGRAFERSVRGKLNSLVVPGPGAYNFRSTLKETLGKMVWKHPRLSKLETPAPGVYNIKPQIDRYRSMFSKGMPGSLRPNIGKSMTNNIGPGQYDVSMHLSSQSGVMNRSPRRCLTTTNNPGPGQYQIPSTIGRIPKYYKNLNKKISEFGDTKTIKYDPASTSKVKLAEVISTQKVEEHK